MRSAGPSPLSPREAIRRVGDRQAEKTTPPGEGADVPGYETRRRRRPSDAGMLTGFPFDARGRTVSPDRLATAGRIVPFSTLILVLGSVHS
jgi:hypothetical protein